MTVFSFVTAMISPSVVSVVTTDPEHMDPQTFFVELANWCNLTMATGTGQFMLQGDWKGFIKAHEILDQIQQTGSVENIKSKNLVFGACQNTGEVFHTNDAYKQSIKDELHDRSEKHDRQNTQPQDIDLENRQKIEAALEGLAGLANPIVSTSYKNVRPYVPELDGVNTEAVAGKSKNFNPYTAIKPTHVATVPSEEDKNGPPMKILIYQPNNKNEKEDYTQDSDEKSDEEDDDDWTYTPKKRGRPPKRTPTKTSPKTKNSRKSKRPQKVSITDGEDYEKDMNGDDSDDDDFKIEDDDEEEANEAVDEDCSSDEEGKDNSSKKIKREEREATIDKFIVEVYAIKSPDEGGTLGKAYQCKECLHTTKDRTMLREHILRKHVDNKDKECPICGKCYSVNKDLKRHLSRHSVRHTCGVCGKQYKAQRNLRDHMSSHEEGYVKPCFPCTECDRKFSAKHTLQTHIDGVHRGIKKSFLCTICGKNFTQKQTMLDHLMIHSGERPFQCEICGSDFNNKQTLKRHRRLHTDIARFQCELCGKEFRSKAGLRMHTGIHTGNVPQHECSVCNKIFTQKQALLRHARIHSGEKPFKCDMCKDAFSDLSILRRHVMGVHKMEFKTKRPRIQPAPAVYKSTPTAEMEANLPPTMVPTSSSIPLHVNMDDNISTQSHTPHPEPSPTMQQQQQHLHHQEAAPSPTASHRDTPVMPPEHHNMQSYMRHDGHNPGGHNMAGGAIAPTVSMANNNMASMLGAHNLPPNINPAMLHNALPAIMSWGQNLLQ